MLKVILAIVFLFVAFIIACVVSVEHEDKQAQKEHFQSQLGTYQLDISRTKLGVYSKDSLHYKRLKITFKKDSTFIMNMQVPFIYDSIGRWNAAGRGLEDWNWMYFKSWGYSKYEENTGNQFVSPWTKDSVFYINSVSPHDGEPFIQEIYFKKISTNDKAL